MKSKVATQIRNDEADTCHNKRERGTMVFGYKEQRYSKEERLDDTNHCHLSPNASLIAGEKQGNSVHNYDDESSLIFRRTTKKCRLTTIVAEPLKRQPAIH